MTPRKLELFLFKPGERGMDDWVVYESTQLDRALFVGSREAAEFEAGRRNQRARSLYRDTALDHVIDAIQSEAEDARHYFEELVRNLEERCQKEAQFGLANNQCLTALSFAS